MEVGPTRLLSTGFWNRTGVAVGKISPYSLGQISPELEQFRDEITNLFNLGKYASAVLNSGAPTWTANKGETVWVMPSSGGTTQYVFRNTAWVALVSVTI